MYGHCTQHKTLAIIHLPVFGTFVKAYNNSDFVHRGGSQYIIELQSELIKWIADSLVLT